MFVSTPSTQDLFIEYLEQSYLKIKTPLPVVCYILVRVNLTPGSHGPRPYKTVDKIFNPLLSAHENFLTEPAE